MLDIITKSKIRKKILILMFSNEHKEFYLSIIAKIVKTSKGTAQRELNKLIQAGFVCTEKKTNLRYYSTNKKNQVYKEIKKIINNTIGVEVEIKKLINKIKNIEFAFIFGSYAKGGITDKSDIDIFIIGIPDENELIMRITKLEKLINRDINYHIYTKKEFIKRIKNNSFLKNIIKNYILLTDNEYEFKKLF